MKRSCWGKFLSQAEKRWRLQRAHGAKHPSSCPIDELYRLQCAFALEEIPGFCELVSELRSLVASGRLLKETKRVFELCRAFMLKAAPEAPLWDPEDAAVVAENNALTYRLFEI